MSTPPVELVLDSLEAGVSMQDASGAIVYVRTSPPKARRRPWVVEDLGKAA